MTMTTLTCAHDEVVKTPFQLLSLPNEIVLDICELLLPRAVKRYKTFRAYKEAEEFISDLASLACSCKKLNSIATELREKHRKHHPMGEGIFGYARAITQNRELAESETIFKLSPLDSNGSLEQGDLQTLDAIAKPLGLVRPSTHRMDGLIQGRNAALEEALSHHKRAQLAYLTVSKLPNLTSMTLYATDTRMFVNRVNPQTVLSLPALKHAKFIGLSSKSLLAWGQMGYFDVYAAIAATRPLRNIASFSTYLNAAPNLEKLEFAHMEACTYAVNICTVRFLRLSSCRLPHSHMLGLGLDRFTPESFVYRTASYHNYLRQNDTEHSWPEITPGQIVDTLMASKSAFDRLETLEIDIRERGQRSRRNYPVTDDEQPKARARHGDQSVEGFIRSLRPFVALQTLSLTQQTLWEPWCVPPSREDDDWLRDEMRLVKLLPPRIVSFSLSDINMGFLTPILALAKNVHSEDSDYSFPQLRRVNLRPSPDFIRQFKHARAHQENPLLDQCKGLCGVNEQILGQRETILRLFEEAGVEADFPFESYPLSTDNEEDLQRQRDLEHWCELCHSDEMGCLEKNRDCLALPLRNLFLRC
ncbi:hypothetical protein F5Y05DRAFT_423135 [Hypoxylon sp. FL0543]|nr:hypothetical protein F5Y05DRAFT_423135 [Hypoxylon sp. FL0543]